MTTSVVEQHLPKAGLLNTGIFCDGLLAVDIDIDDAPAVAHIRSLARQYLGSGLERGRENTARSLLLYRAADELPVIRDLVGTDKRRIQFLGQGLSIAEPPARQFLTDGVLECGSRYQWAQGWTPHLSFTRDQLTEVTADALAAFLIAVAPVIGAEHPTAPLTPMQSNSGQGSISHVPTVATSDDLAYFRKAFDREREAYRKLKEGRNWGLMKLAKFAGNFIPNYGLDHNQLANELLDDARANGYINDHGESTAVTTIRHNVREGATEPRPIGIG